MQNVFVMNQSWYSSRQPLNLHLQTTYGLNSFRYEGAKLWNSLPEDIKSSENLITFKRFIKTWNGTTCKRSFCDWWNGDLPGKSIPMLHTPVHWGVCVCVGGGDWQFLCCVYDWWEVSVCSMFGGFVAFRWHSVVSVRVFLEHCVLSNGWSVVRCCKWSERGLFSCNMHGASIDNSFQWYL